MFIRIGSLYRFQTAVLVSGESVYVLCAGGYIIMAIYDCPFFVSPHAVERFRHYVAELPAGEIIRIIQQNLQHPGNPIQWEIKSGTLAPIFQFSYGDKKYYVPVMPGDGEWPVVPTIIGQGSQLHWNILRGKIKKGEIFIKRGEQHNDDKGRAGPQR